MRSITIDDQADKKWTETILVIVTRKLNIKFVNIL